MRQQRLSFFPILALLLLVSFPLLAQLQSAGNVVGQVVDTSGNPIPGVTVSLSGLGVQTTVTQTDGRYRFLNLAPGRYVVKAVLPGFSTVTRTATVSLGQNTEIDFRLDPALDQSITVTGESPMLDTRRTGTETNVSEEELQHVPTARDPWVILQTVPGILMDRVNVGGNESGQQSYFVSKGVERHQTNWNLDGVTVTEMTATGSSGFYYDFESFEEFNVITGGSDPSIKTPGAQVNMVTRRGTNEFRGSGRYLFVDEEFQADPTVPEEAQDYLEQSNSIDRITELGIELGGPLWRDRLWLWGAFSQNDISNFVYGGAYPQTTELESWNAKLNGQLAANNNASLFYMFNDKVVAGRGISSSRPPEAAQNQSGPGRVLKLEDTHIFSPSLYVTGMISDIDNGYELAPVNGMDIEPYWEGRGDALGRGWRRNYRLYSQDVPQEQYRADASSFFETGTWSHELKFGFGYRETPVESWTIWPGTMSWGEFYRTRRGVEWGLAALTRPGHPVYGSDYTDFYVGDTVLLGNVTIQGGLRYDLQQARNFESRVPANPIIPDILPEGVYPGDEQTLEWESISPRLGATWAVGEEKKTLVRGHYARYVDQLGSSDVGPQNPYYVDQILYYYWDDTNGDTRVQREEIDFDSGLYSWSGIDPDNPDATISTGRIDYNMDPTTTDEFLVGIEREIMPAVSVGFAYTHRIRKNFLWDRYEKTRGAGDFYTAADWEPAGSIEGTLPDGKKYTVPLYELRSGINEPIYYVYTNRPDYEQVYDGLELTLTKRMSNNWMMRGNVSWNDWTQKVGEGAIQDPNIQLSGDGCFVCDGGIVASSSGADGYINSRWSGALTGVYQLPWQVTIGAGITAREGFLIGYHRRERLDGERKNILVADFEDYRLDDLMQVDLRLAKSFSLPAGAGLTLAADLFNVTDERTVLWRGYQLYEDLADGGFDTDGNRVVELQSPRVWRFSGRITW